MKTIKKTLKLTIIAALAVFASSWLGTSYAKNLYYFSDIPGLISAPDDDPFADSVGTGNGSSDNEEEEDSIGNITIDIDTEIVFNSNETSKLLPYTLTSTVGADLSGATIEVTNNDTDIIDSASAPSTGNSGTITIERLLSGNPGEASLKLSVISNNIAETTIYVNALVASACSTPIDTTDATDPSGTGHAILCDSNGKYLISSKEDLLHISRNQNTSGISSAIRTGDYRLTKDIAFSSTPGNEDWDGDGVADGAGTTGWVPLGIFTSYFTSTFDGGGHSISNLYIKRATGSLGLYGGLKGDISNLQLLNVDIENTSTGYHQGLFYVGGLVGQLQHGNISKCSVTGSVKGVQQVGGLVGYSWNGNIDQSFSDCVVTANYNNIGGLSGGSYGTGYIKDSYALGNVSGDSSSLSVGGIVGFSSDGVENCYYSGAVSGRSGIGSIAGSDENSSSLFKNSYSMGTVSGITSNFGGLVGGQSGVIENSGDKCEYTTGNAVCSASDSLYIRAHGLWEDGVWEDLNDSTPKLEWETAGKVTSNITIPPLSGCN
jgi:hypothetical protein